MRPAIFLRSALLSALLLSPAVAFAQAESREGIYLQNQILQLRQELEQMRRGGSSLGGPPVSAPRGGGGGELVGQLLDRVNSMEEEVRRLRGRVDEMDNRNRRLQADVEKLQGDLDYRLQQLEGGGGRPGNPPPRQGNANPPSPPPGQPGGGSRPPERALADGNAAIGRRDYAAAEAAAREVIGNRGAATRAVDAQLLLGNALTGKRDFAGAALAYNEAYTRSRTGPRAPEAMIGLAGSFASLGNRREACDTLDDLRSNFPNLRGPVADRATETRRRAGCR